MRILSISWLHTINFGGVEARAKEISQALSDRHDVTMLSARVLLSKKPQHPTLKHKQLILPENPYKSLIWNKPKYEALFIKRAISFIKKNAANIDIVDAQGISSVSSIRNHVPTLATIHGLKDVFSPAVHETAKGADHIIAITHKVKNTLIEKGYPHNKITVIHNPINTKLYNSVTLNKEELIKAYQLNPDKKIILSVHNYDPKKNTQRCIQAFIEADLPEYQYVIIGNGQLYSEISTLISKEKRNDIHLLGRLAPELIVDFYHHSNCLLQPSLEGESWGIVFLEAMACGCPIITSSCCGITEAVGPEIATIVTNPYEVDQIKSALQQTLFTQSNDIEFKGTLLKFANKFDTLQASESIESIMKKILCRQH